MDICCLWIKLRVGKQIDANMKKFFHEKERKLDTNQVENFRKKDLTLIERDMNKILSIGDVSF